MSQVNTCLRRTFTVFNVFFAIIGALVIGLAFLHQVLTSFHGGENVMFGIYVLYVVGTVTMVIASLGAYGAHKENKLCLSLFLGFMVTGSLMMLTYGIPAATSRHQVEEMIEDDLRAFVPLDDAPEEIKSMMDIIQTQVHCCGMFSSADWRDIPESCMCSPAEEDECQAANYKLAFWPTSVSVYSKTCLPFIMVSFRLIVDVLIGGVFTLAALAILGTILSSIMIHQMRCSAAPALLKMPPAFIALPPKYEELREDPPAYC